jgi:thiol:disulfide interchange protein
LVTAIALNLAGLFALPTINLGGGLTRRKGFAGAFWTGALVAFVAAPCTGPFMATALGVALILPPPAALGVFAGLGLGLALPFLLLAYVPALRRRIPRPGPWMATLQHILAVPMFLTALALLWLLGQQGGTAAISLGAAAALLTGLLLWWSGQRQRAGRSAGALVAGALLAPLTLGWLLPDRSSVTTEAVESTVRFDETELVRLTEAGKPVFLYFTADWCLSCKVNEAAAIDRREVVEAFREVGVTVMVGDWTRADPAIGHFLERNGRSGVPLYLWYAPGHAPEVLPQILTPGILTALVQAE